MNIIRTKAKRVMSSKLYKRIFYKHWNVNFYKYYLDHCLGRVRMGLMTSNEYEKEYEREFNSFKQKFIKYFPQVKLKELK